jgi:glutamyl-tRNA reductase
MGYNIYDELSEIIEEKAEADLEIAKEFVRDVEIFMRKCLNEQEEQQDLPIITELSKKECNIFKETSGEKEEEIEMSDEERKECLASEVCRCGGKIVTNSYGECSYSVECNKCGYLFDED